MKIIALGSAALMDGFSLMGVETHADPDPDQVNRVLSDLKHSNQRALVYIQQELMTDKIPMVQQLRNQGGSILLCELPALQQVDNFKPNVERLIGKVMGATVQEGLNGQ